MGIIRGIFDALLQSELAHVKGQLDYERKLRCQHEVTLACVRKENEALTETMKQQNVKINQLIQQNCSLTTTYVVPDAIASVTGRTRKCPLYFQQLYGGAYQHCDKGVNLTACDFSVLEARIAADMARPPRYYAMSYDQKGKESAKASWFYVYDRDSTDGGAHIARFTTEFAARQYVEFLNRKG